jgi:phosphinothricin acetyltransferase
VEIRSGTAEDLTAIARIYRHYVLHSLATFDEAPPSPEYWGAWFDKFSLTGPHRLVVADDGRVQGYASSLPYRAHPAFAETVEFSVYVSSDRTGNGLGRLLYGRLIDELEGLAVHRVVAGIALPNDASVRLHRSFGFDEIGVFEQYAKKWGRYVSSVWMQRAL